MTFASPNEFTSRGAGAPPLIVAILLLMGCDIGVSAEELRPVAVAGEDRRAQLKGEPISLDLDGGRSFIAGRVGERPDRYEWSIVVAPPRRGELPPARLTAPGSEATTIEIDSPGLYVLRLDVFFLDHQAAPDYVGIIASESPSPQRPPIADAGPDQEVAPGELVTLDAGESYCHRGEALVHEWSQVLGTRVSLEGSHEDVATFVAPAPRAPATRLELKFHLVVINESGLVSQPDSVKVVVIEDSEPPALPLVLTPSRANFGTVWTGSTSGPRLFEVENPPDGITQSPSVSLAGDHREQFEVSFDGCGNAPIAPGDSCPIELRFSPEGQSGPRNSELIVESEDGQTSIATLTGISDAWYDSAWGRRLRLTVEAAAVSGDGCLHDFPLLLRLENSALSEHAHPDGDDILFTGGDGTTRLAHEIERWTQETGELTAWVRVPCLSGSEDTSIFVYYDAPSAAENDPANVWEAGFSAVYHLSGSPRARESLSDSTGNENQLSSSHAAEASFEDVLAIGGVVTRNGVDSPAFDELGGLLHFDTSNVDGLVGHQVSDDGLGGWMARATWSTARRVTGILALFEVPGAQRVQHAVSPNLGWDGEFHVDPTPGNLLIAVSGHRQSGENPSIDGWELQHQALTDLTDFGNRRGIAILARIAEGGEPRSASVEWHDSSGSWLILQEFSSTSESLSLPLPTVAVASDSGHGTTETLEIPPSGLEEVEAVISTGIGFPGDAGGEYLRASNSSSLDLTGEAFTLEAWVHAGPEGWSEDVDNGIISKPHAPDGNVERYHLGVNRNGHINVRRYSDGSLVRFDATGEVVPEDRWVYVAARYDGEELTAWMDGIQVGAADASGSIDSSDRELRLGARYDGRRFSGLMEEARISSVARSDAWLATTFRNQSSPETFVLVGLEDVFVRN